jgi:hypothetical protein
LTSASTASSSSVAVSGGGGGGGEGGGATGGGSAGSTGGGGSVGTAGSTGSAGSPGPEGEGVGADGPAAKSDRPDSGDEDASQAPRKSAAASAIGRSLDGTPMDIPRPYRPGSWLTGAKVSAARPLPRDERACAGGARPGAPTTAVFLAEAAPLSPGRARPTAPAGTPPSPPPSPPIVRRRVLRSWQECPRRV